MEDKVFNAVMLTTTLPINEVTYNKNEDEWYVDKYIKVNNRCISNGNLEEYSKTNSQIIL